MAITEFSSLSPEQLLGRALNSVEAKRAPKVLFISGDRSIMRSAPRVAVVGMREPSQRGVDFAGHLCECLLGNGAVIVSGLARGIDTIAHSQTLNSGGKTVAVLGTPLDQATPKSNEPLQQRIMREHLAVSQFPVGSTVSKEHFPQRNVTMALLSDVTVIVEAGEISGTKNQGWEALRLGRPLFIASTMLSESAISWATQMLEYGAQELSLASFDALLETLPVRKSRNLSELVP